MLLIIAFLVSSLLFSNALIIDKEQIFEYHARIRVGTHEPVPHGSQLILNGKLHLQESSNSVLVRFTNLTYQLYNGVLNQKQEYESKSLPLPIESADLLRVFRIEYDEDGKLRNIVTESDEARYAKNMKKAIASILQLDLTRIQLNETIPHAFITEERSIYGTGPIEYNVLPLGDEIIVQKMQDVTNSRHWFNYFSLNVDPLPTGVPITELISTDSNRQYILQRNGKLKRIEAHGGVYVHGLNGISGTQFMTVNQTFQLLETIPITNKYEMKNEDRTDNIDFKIDMNTESGVLDLTFDRYEVKKEDDIKLVHAQLTQVVAFLQDYRLTINVTKINEEQIVNRLQHTLTYLDIPSLQEIYNHLTESNKKQELNVFLQVLPLVGTRASIMFVRNLIRTHQVNEESAIEMLNKLPFHAYMANEQMLQEVEDLLDLEVGINVKRTAVLCFASLVHKVFEHKHEIHLNSYHYHHGRRDPEGNQLLEKYTVEILNRLKNSNDYASQVLYIQALQNIQIGTVSKHLEPYVTGHATADPNLRFLAMSASMKNAQQQEPEHVYEIYWPIFTDRELHLELRAIAYLIIMNTHSTLTNFWNIYWFMQTEHRPELYHLYYTHLKSLAETKIPRLQKQAMNAAQILKYIRKPYQTHLTGNYLFDYTDPKYNFGAMLQALIISTNSSKTLRLDMTSHVLNIPFQNYGLLIKINGLDPLLVSKQIKEPVVKEVEELINWIKSIPKQTNIRIEYFVYHHNQIVRFGLYDQNNAQNFVTELSNYFQIEDNNLLKNSLHIQYNLRSDLLLPNDLGLPVTVLAKWPTVTNNLYKITREVVNNIVNVQAEIKLQTSIHGTSAMLFYNPISDIWHGVHRLHSYDHVIPLNFNAAINKQQQSVKLTLNRVQNERQGTIGLRSHVTTEVFVYGDRMNLLKQSNERCERFVIISRGKQQRKTVNLLQVEDENTGLRYEITAFDQDRSINQNDLIGLLVSLAQNNNKNSGSLPLIGTLLTIRNLWTRLILYPSVETSGILIRGVPSRESYVTHIDLSIRLNHETSSGENIREPSTKINTRATYSVKTGDKLAKTWDLNGLIELNLAHTINNYKLQITKIVPNQKDYKICVEGMKKWIRSQLTGHTTIMIGNCNKDESAIEIDMKSERITDPQSPDQCSTQYYDPQLQSPQTIDCVQEYTTVRRYVYNIKAIKLPDNVKSKILHAIHMIRSVYVPYFMVTQQKNPIPENSVKIVVEHPVVGNEVDVQIMTPNESYNMSNVPVITTPDSYHLSMKFRLMNDWGMVKSCLVTNVSLIDEDNNLVASSVPNEWTEYVKDSNEKPNVIVYLKQVKVNGDSLLALRIVSQGQQLEIASMNNKSAQITVNGQPLIVTPESYRQESWISIGVLDDQIHTVVLHVYKIGLYITFNGRAIRFDVSRLGSGLVGQCFR